MTRQFPTEIFIGQIVYLHFEAMGRPVEAAVTYLDYATGRVHLQPVGDAQKFAAHPRAVSSLNGHHLHFEDSAFYFSAQPMWN
jgi:hypothetical protein